MRSPAGSEKMSDLIFSALADPSGRYKGRILLEYCYRKMDVRQTFHHFSWEDRTAYVKLFEMLLKDGADAGVFLRKNAEDFSYLQKAAREALKLIRVLLSGDRINGNGAPLSGEGINGNGVPLSGARINESRTGKSLRLEKGFDLLMACAAELADLLEDDLAVLTADIPLPSACGGGEAAGDIAFLFEDCMRGIHRLEQPCLAMLEAAIREGADVTSLFDGAVLPIYTAERLLTVTADALRLLAETARGRGARDAMKDLPSVSGNFSALGTAVKQLLRETLSEDKTR